MRPLSFLTLFLLVAPVGQGQIVLPEPPDTTDFGAWTTLKADWKPVKGITLELKEQVRLKDDLGALDRHFHQVSVGWSPRWSAVTKAQQLVLGSRLQSVLDNTGDKQGWERYFRWHVDHVTKVDVKRWTVVSRIRYQERSALKLVGGDASDLDEIKRMWRIKAGLSYNIKGWKLDPRCSVERFIAPVPEGWPGDGVWRARFGTDFKGGKRQRIKVVLQREWRGKYLPSGTGATLDDFRLYGNDDWALLVSWRYRFKKRKAD